MKLYLSIFCYVLLVAILCSGCPESTRITTGSTAYFIYLYACNDSVTNLAQVETVDIGTSPATVNGPFFAGQLGSATAGPLFDAATTTDGRYVLVSYFLKNTVYRIDMQDPANPTLAGALDIGFSAEDIAVAPQGNFALVTDGGLSQQVAIIALPTCALTTVYNLTSGLAQAVAIGPDNTAIFCDYSNQKIIYGQIDPVFGLISEATLPASRPVNVAISPDGKTAVAVNADNTTPTLAIFQITAPGVVTPGATPFINGLPGGAQSVAFSPSGDRAYILHNQMKIGTDLPDQLSYLTVHEPGNVSLDGIGVANLNTSSGSQLFGVDVLTITPDGAYALTSTPTVPAANQKLSLVDLKTFNVTAISTKGDVPCGIAAVPVLKK